MGCEKWLLTMADTYLELVKTGGAIGCLIVAVRWLAAQWTAAQAQLVAMLSTTIQQNSELLREVRDTLKQCHDKRTKT